MSAQKKVAFNDYNSILMRPDCHPEQRFKLLYVPQHGGDAIKASCEQCGRHFFTIKLPTESKE